MIAKAVLLVLLAGGPFLGASGLAFVATDLTADEVVLCRRVQAGEGIALVFTHSMYGGDVREEYVATADARLRRTAVTTANLAAAEYYAYTAGVLREGDRYRLDVPAVSFERIVLRADRVGDHRLDVGGATVDLVARAGDGHQVRLAVEARPVWDRLLGGAC